MEKEKTSLGPPSVARRGFLRSAASAGLLLLKPATAFGSAANSSLELGIIGCGGRGNFIGGHFVEHTQTRIVALADPFEDRSGELGKTFKVDSSRLYGGLDGYRELLDTEVDAVAVMSPPYFHPEQVEAAVEAGKHVFLAKPVAVDVPGCRSIEASGRKARGKVSFLVDFQTRAQPVFQEAARRVHRGAIGDAVLGQVYYHANRLEPKGLPTLSQEQNRLRNWVFDQKLSGDVIVEQNVHVLDVANWYLEARPLRAFGTGGRKARVDVGDCWDHFVVTFWYPNEVRVDFSSAQFVKGFPNDLCIRVYGSKGTVDSHYNGVVHIGGDNPWTGTGSEVDPTGRQGAIANVKSFVESIRSGRLLNNAEGASESTMTSILGRMAAYRESIVSWEQMLQDDEKLDAALSL